MKHNSSLSPLCSMLTTLCSPFRKFHVNLELCFIPCSHFQVSALGAEFSSEACRELGFSSNLLCSSCDLLGQFNLLQLDPACRGCCQEEAQFETKKVPFSVVSLPSNALVERDKVQIT